MKYINVFHRIKKILKLLYQNSTNLENFLEQNMLK